jgi:hypothetical protein
MQTSVFDSFNSFNLDLSTSPDNNTNEQFISFNDYFNQLFPDNIFNSHFFSKDDYNDYFTTQDQLNSLENIINNLNTSTTDSQTVNYLNDLNKIYENFYNTDEEKKRALFLIEILLDKLNQAASKMLQEL